MIAHLCHQADWQQALQAGEYRPPSLVSAGFIHASLPEQVLAVANRFYTGNYDLLLLWIDPQRVSAPVRYEPADGELYPHIYGALNLDAVRGASAFSPDADGVFRHLPPGGPES